ncbi:hypothetical protein ACIBG0_11825 [Nocardia sp. NPDC050630]|uniref:hypothetical protein n=1 Tax=Nocardia sp. NPDC050630 TaxID=3364321 RepID=UPI00379632EE
MITGRRIRLIARTDADTLVDPDWGEVIRGHFIEHPDTAALTGITTYHDSPVGFLLKLGIYLQDRRGKFGGRVGNLQGANMAIRRTAWQSRHRAFIVGAWLTHTVQWPIYRFWDFERRRFTARPGAARISAVGD